MNKFRETLCKIVLVTSAVSLGVLNTMSAEAIVFGNSPTERISNFTARDYSQNCKTPLTKTLAYLSYPGAKIATYIHNRRLNE